MIQLIDFAADCTYAQTVCDSNGIVLYMNEKAGQVFAKYGGRELIGKSLMDCHTPKSRERILDLLKTGTSNSYTIKKNGVKKLIHQTPWYSQGKIAGLIEISIELPAEMPHFERN